MSAMAVGILIITHDGIGAALLEVATSVYGRAPMAARALAVLRDVDPESAYTEAMRLRRELEGGAGVLVLSDLYGSTPGNVAQRVADSGGARVVSGVSLPMLVGVFNYPDLELDALARKAAQAGREGVRA